MRVRANCGLDGSQEQENWWGQLTKCGDNKFQPFWRLHPFELRRKEERYRVYGVYGLTRHFIDCIGTGRQSETSMVDAFKPIALKDAIYWTQMGNQGLLYHFRFKMIKWCSSFWKQRIALGQMAFRRERRSLRLPGPRAQPSAAALLTPKNPFCHCIILNLKWY